MRDPIRILIVEDHQLIRAALMALIQAENGRRDENEFRIEVVGEAADGLEAVVQAALLKPDVILMDLQLPHKTGIEAIEEIVRNQPRTRILVLTNFTGDIQVVMAIKAGALGYLLKDSSTAEFFQAIFSVYHGEYVFHPTIAQKVVQGFQAPHKVATIDETLTDRETEVLTFVARGLSNREIATLLGIHERTVSTHVSNVLIKLHLTNRTQATLYALNEGLVTLDQIEIHGGNEWASM